MIRKIRSRLPTFFVIDDSQVLDKGAYVEGRLAVRDLVTEALGLSSSRVAPNLLSEVIVPPAVSQSSDRQSLWLAKLRQPRRQMARIEGSSRLALFHGPISVP